MVTVTGTEQYEAWQDRRLPVCEQVAPTVWSIPVRCDDFPVRHTFCYLLANDQGEYVLVDPGANSEEGVRDLTTAIKEIGLADGNLVGVVATHYHPDHLGLVHHFCTEGGPWFGLHPTDAHSLAGRALSSEQDADWLRSSGVPEERFSELLLTRTRWQRLVRPVEPTLSLTDGLDLPLRGRRLRVVETPGHTAGHVCVLDHDNSLILTGDHVLPRITPNIGVDAMSPHRDAVGEYFSSLTKVARWDHFEALPAHEYRFTGLADRCHELRLHHVERSAEVWDLMQALPTASGWDIAAKLTWSRGWASLDGDNMRNALSETMSHINYIELTGGPAQPADIETLGTTGHSPQE